MAGLIWAGIGQGIANAGATAANIGVRDYEMREAARLRNEAREEDRAWREEQKEIDRDRQDERDRMYRKTVEQQIAGNKGTSGMKGFAPEDLAPGGKLADMMAGQMGMTVPEYEQFYNARKTGNMSAYATESKDVGKVLDDEYGEQTVTERVVPAGFQKEFAAKSRMLSDIQQSYVAGSEAKNIAEARQIGLVTNAMEGAQAGGDVTKAAQLAAISKGHVPYAGDSNVTRNVLTGDTSTTAVGTATISEKGALAKQAEAGEKENAAQARAADALADKHKEEITKIREDVKKIQAEIPEVNARTKKIQAETGQVGKDGGNDKTQERLSSVINSANATLKSLEETKPPASSPARAGWDAQYADALALRAEATRLQKEALGARAAPPAATSGTRPVADDGIPTVTYEEAKKLKSGTRFRIKGTNEIREKN